MKTGENIVSDWLTQLGYKPKRFTKQEMRQDKKTPDFKVYDEQSLAFYCEEKTFTQSFGYDNTPADEIASGLDLESTKLNRLIERSRDAIKKFSDSNPNHVIPNMIAIVNHDETFFPDVIEELFRGYALTSDGEKIDYFPKAGRKRISEELHWVDAILVFQHIEQPPEKYEKLFYKPESVDRFDALKILLDRCRK